MTISRVSIGLAVRAVREAAGLTLSNLASKIGMTTSTLSRSELGERDLAYAEVIAITEVTCIGMEELRTLAETFERDGAAKSITAQKNTVSQLIEDLNKLQRQAIEAAISARMN